MESPSACFSASSVRMANIQTYVSLLHYQGGTLEGHTSTRISDWLFGTSCHSFRKWTRVPDDYETTYQQMLTRCSSQIL